MALDCTNIKLKKGSKGAKVTEAQKMLKNLGYYNSTIDGSFGAVTEQAVKKFQKANTGLAVDGWIGPVTCKRLNEKNNQASPTNKTDGTAGTLLSFNCNNISLRKGSKDTENVKKLQTMLKELGYYTREVDGDFGTYTDSALKQFQRDTGHTPDGVFASKTCPDLNRKYQELKVAQVNAKNEVVKPTAVTVVKEEAKPKVDPLYVNPETEQWLNSNDLFYTEPNLFINGIGVIVETVNPKNSFKEYGYGTVELLNNKTKVYPTHRSLLEYEVTTHIQEKYYTNAMRTLGKIKQQVCTVVSSLKLFRSGLYVLTDIAVSEAKGNYIGFTLHFLEVEV